MTPRILIVAGSDSGGGAGIQADIKTVTMLGGHAMTAITAITAQNTLGVQAVLPIAADMVIAQIESVVSDIGVDAVKIGMIGSAATARAVADALAGLAVPIVFDPVMVATSGDTLADADTIAAFARLMALATVVTPNLPELAALGGEAMVRAHGCAVLVKGGHGDGEMLVDRLVAANGRETRWESPRIATTSTHGTGCTLASAIATGLGHGLPLDVAVARARTFVRVALHDAPGLGGGHGSMGHQRVRQDVAVGLASPNHVTLPMTDFAATRAFYDLLGLTRIVDAEPRYARYESPGGATLSIEAAHELDGRPLTFLECDDLDAAVARLRGGGYVVSDPVVEPWAWREARLTDPFGNALCLYEAGEMRRFPPWRLPHA
ncbi:MAG: bifunctional hydroxymethylpyrimidine kinase/phosphomethylpyrimidine kinase [Sphingomonas sp.]|uniref:bifunctional hydroxymethylpyrimidine kinase/phosphomethylpyrimidine kinase n=1 Tax=Sphingomonas sp. TaxID=28214 RepID=UPI001AC027F5|nr:bifunctional hydroxymethylpyrimidine kinase/phosphomethylpyrimidine kinase [Sphingomonas sp.]MBN8809593.1 bifunctional hydroxymethylpyrimidine kinase/phosphomethylpyrimidine kinase [Sphingomonas sp.]